MNFAFDFTFENLQKLLPKTPNLLAWYDSLVAVLPNYEITTPERVGAFIAQCGHESAGFTVLSENLNYSAEGLSKIWPKRFPVPIAEQYARKPEMIANKTYADRLGNGPESSGDGWKYRGRGLIQLTGKTNYNNFAKSINKTLDEAVAYCETPSGAIESACYFWKTRKCNVYADRQDIVGLTKVINGGEHGLEDRIARYNAAMKEFK